MRVFYIASLAAGLTVVDFFNSQEAIDYLTSEDNPTHENYIPQSQGWFDCTNITGVEVQTLASVQQGQTAAAVSITRQPSAEAQRLAETESAD